MQEKTFWPPEEVVALRNRITVDRNGELVPINQADFGMMVGHYTQPTISTWENAGCNSRRGCADLQRVKDDLDRMEAAKNDA